MICLRLLFFLNNIQGKHTARVPLVGLLFNLTKHVVRGSILFIIVFRMWLNHCSREKTSDRETISGAMRSPNSIGVDTST